MKRMIVGITGKARSGKDTVAEYLVRVFGYTRFAFADQLKDIVCDMFDWGPAHRDGELKEEIDHRWGFSPRRAFQLFGTEFGRALNPNLWVKMADRKLGAGLWVIPDVRFENEASFVRMNGILIHIERPGIQDVSLHISEAGIPFWPNIDYKITNDGSIWAAHASADLILANAYRRIDNA